MNSPRIGSSFKSFLEDEGIREEMEDLFQKRALAWQIEEAMKQTGITKVEMAQWMHTSRTQLERLLDPTDNRVQLDTLQRATRAVGRTLKLELV
jgi:hypothetical protein